MGTQKKIARSNTMETSVTMDMNVQKESIKNLLRMADWATLCIEAWHEHCPNEISNIDSYLPQFKEAITQLCIEMNIDPPQWC
jgi:hypothetical protein